MPSPAAIGALAPLRDTVPVPWALIHMDPLCGAGLMDWMPEHGGIHAGHRFSRRRPRLLRADGPLRPLGGRSLRPAMLDLLLGGAVAAALALYLVAALIRPESF